MHYIQISCAHRISILLSQGGSQMLSATSGWLTEALRHFKVAHRGSQTPQCGSQRFSETSGLAHRSSQNSHRCSNNLRLLTEALRQYRIAHRSSQIPQDGSQRLKHLNVVYIGSQTPQGSSQRFSHLSVAQRGSQTLQAGSQRLSDITG